MQGRDFSKNKTELMKNKLNIYCILTIVFLLFSISENLYGFFIGVKSGVEMAKESIEKKDKTGEKHAYKMGYELGKGTAIGVRLQNIGYVDVMPSSLLHTERWMKNDLTGDSVAFWPAQLIVSPEQSASATPSFWGLTLIKGFLPIVILVLGIISLVLFYKLVWRINHQEVFSWKNVRTLRKIALYLILFAVFSTGSSLMNAYQMNQAFALEGYSVNYLGCFSFLSFLLGMVSLIVAEVFSIGLKMQEEQELTI